MFDAHLFGEDFFGGNYFFYLGEVHTAEADTTIEVFEEVDTVDEVFEEVGVLAPDIELTTTWEN